MADQADKLLGTVVKDAKEGGVTRAATGLILVIDVKEKPPFEVSRLVEVLGKAEAQATGEEAREIVKSVTRTKKQFEDEGLDVNTLLSLSPIPIRPAALPEVVGEFPQDMSQQVDWCVIVPTSKCTKAGLKKIIEAEMKKKKPGLAERAALFAMMPIVERKAVERVKKRQQLVLYELLCEAQTDLSQEQKVEKAETYRRKLGLDDDSGDPNSPKDEKATATERAGNE